MRFVFLISLFLAFPAQALICSEDNTAKCAELGYNQSSCPKGGIACPFDTSKWHCAEWNCADGRYLSSPKAGKNCTEVNYKGLSCYDCENSLCGEGYIFINGACQPKQSS